MEQQSETVMGHGLAVSDDPRSVSRGDVLCAQGLSAFDLLDHPIWVVSLKTLRPLRANKALLNLLGLPSVAAWGASCPCLPAPFDHLVSLDPQGIPDHVQGPLSLLDSPAGQRAEMDGHHHALICKGQRSWLEDGTPVMVLHGSLETSLPCGVGGESVLHSALSALNHTTVMVSVFNDQGILQYQNPAAAIAYGANPDALGSFLNRIPDSQEAVTAWAAMRRGRAHRCELTVRTLSGPRWHALEGCPIPPADTSGAPMIVITEHDITDHIQNQYSLQKTVERLAHTNAEMEQFVWVSSHDLREPLRTVVSYITLLERHLDRALDSTAREYMQFALNGAKRMDALSRDFLNYITVGRGTTVAQTIDLASLIASQIAERRQALDACDGEVIYQDLPKIQGNLSEISLVFAQLLDNAIAYRKPDQPLRIQIVAEEEHRAWLIAVIDNGIGIKPQYFDRIFQLFQRLGGMSSHLGTGVGLALCRKVIEAHGGRIWVESQEGRGAAFFLRFPSLPGSLVK